jgi:hypothetical protein
MFIPGKPFQPGLMSGRKARAYRSKVPYLSGAPLDGRLIALSKNIILGLKVLPGTNTLAYYEHL